MKRGARSALLGGIMQILFDLELGQILVQCTYRFQLEEAICRFDPFHALPTRRALGRA